MEHNWNDLKATSIKEHGWNNNDQIKEIRSRIACNVWEWIQFYTEVTYTALSTKPLRCYIFSMLYTVCSVKLYNETRTHKKNTIFWNIIWMLRIS